MTTGAWRPSGKPDVSSPAYRWAMEKKEERQQAAERLWKILYFAQQAHDDYAL